MKLFETISIGLVWLAAAPLWSQDQQRPVPSPAATGPIGDVLTNEDADRMLTPPPVSGGYATANQSGGGLAFAWNGDAPGFTTLVQANSSGAPFGPFIGSGTDLNNTTLTASNTHAVFGYEFSGSVAQSSLLAVSETSAYPAPVPEPPSVALILSGMVAVALMFRRGRSKNLDFHARLC